MFFIIANLGFVIFPVVGIVLTVLGCLPTMTTVLLLSLAWCGLTFVPFLPAQVKIIVLSYLQAQIATFCVFAIARVCVHSSWASYIASISDIAQFGQRCGTGWFLAAMISLAEKPLVKFTAAQLNNNFFYANLGTGAIIALGFVPLLALFFIKLRKSYSEGAQ